MASNATFRNIFSNTVIIYTVNIYKLNKITSGKRQIKNSAKEPTFSMFWQRALLKYVFLHSYF